VVLAVAYTAIGWLRHRNHWSGGFDLGVFDHALWRLSVGEGLDSSVLGRSVLGDHLSPALLLLVPAYVVAASPLWLFAVQGAALGATVVPLRALAREVGAPEQLASLGVDLSAPLLAASVFDAHPAVLAVPFVAGGLLGAVREEPRLTAWCSIAIVLCRVDLALVVVGIAVVRWNGATRRALWVVPVGAAATLLLPTLVDSVDFWGAHYPAFGSGPLDALVHPQRLIEGLRQANLGDKALIWLLPAGFLTILRPRWLAGLAVGMAPALLSRWEGNALPWYHHAALTVPFVLGGALEALALARDRRGLLLGAAAAGAALSLGGFSPLSAAAPDDLSLLVVLDTDATPGARRLIAQVAPGEAVSAINTIVPHVDHRASAWVWPAPFRDSIPPELGVEADQRAARAIDVLIVFDDDRRYLEAFGFEVADEQGGLLLGRRPDGDRAQSTE
jgi:uncharacterized membrane protein